MALSADFGRYGVENDTAVTGLRQYDDALLDLVMPKTLNPLVGDQREKWREAARAGDPFEEFVGLVMPDSGLRINAMAHFVEDWWHPRAKHPHIKVPDKQECRIGWGELGVNDTAGDPCYHCENLEDEYGVFTPKTENSENRQVPIHNEETQEIITAWFNLHDTVGSKSKIRDAVYRITERSDLDRHVKPHQLRQTFATKLAETGHTAHEIRTLLGHASVEEAMAYVRMYGPDVLANSAEKWESNAD